MQKVISTRPSSSSGAHARGCRRRATQSCWADSDTGTRDDLRCRANTKHEHSRCSRNEQLTEAGFARRRGSASILYTRPSGMERTNAVKLWKLWTRARAESAARCQKRKLGADTHFRAACPESRHCRDHSLRARMSAWQRCEPLSIDVLEEVLCPREDAIRRHRLLRQHNQRVERLRIRSKRVRLKSTGQ